MIPIFCINRAIDVGRKTFMANQFKAQKISAIFIDAIDGNSLSESEAVIAGYDKVARERLYVPLHMNEIGCLLSHRKALELFIDTEEAFGVILEDDAVVSNNFIQTIQKIVTSVTPWDLIKLETRNGEFVGKRIGVVEPNLTIFATLKASRRTTGLLYSRDGAIRILNTLSKFVYPIDNHLGGVWKNKVRILGVFPSLISVSRDYDTGIPQKGSVKPIKSYKYFFHVKILKLQNSIGKRLWAYRVAKSTRIINIRR